MILVAILMMMKKYLIHVVINDYQEMINHVQGGETPLVHDKGIDKILRISKNKKGFVILCILLILLVTISYFI